MQSHDLDRKHVSALRRKRLKIRQWLAKEGLMKKPVPVLIGDQLASEAITWTTAGLALATISGIGVARTSKATQTAKKISNRIEVLCLMELPILTGADSKDEHRIDFAPGLSCHGLPVLFILHLQSLRCALRRTASPD